MNAIACELCGSAAYPDDGAHAHLALAQAPTPCVVWRCRTCGLRWLTPYAGGDDCQRIYDRNYYESAQESGRSYLDEKAELRPCYRLIASRFGTLGVRGRLLDVGCGTGDFLEVARDHGFSAVGIEPSAYAAAVAARKGLEVRCGVLADILSDAQRYSAAHCSHVLEHVPDMHAFMDELNAVLLPGAPLYIEVPLQFDGILDWMERMLGRRRAYSDYSIHHHYFFTAKALKQLLHAHGFAQISVTTFMPCRRASRAPGVRKWGLQALLWMADRFAGRGDVLSVWARRAR